MQHAIRSVSPSCPAEFMQDVPVGGWSWCWSTDKSLVKALIVTMFISYRADFFVNNFKLPYNIKWDTNTNFLIHLSLPAFLPSLPKAVTVLERPSFLFLQREQAWPHKVLGNQGTLKWTSYSPTPKPGCSPLPWILAALGRLKNSSLFAYLFRDTVFEMESLWRALSTLKDH